MQMAVIGLCVVCNKEAEKKCSRCKNVSYCSKECQALNWKLHKKVCQAYEQILPNDKTESEVVQTPCYNCVPIEGKGEGLKASRDIKYGELIVLEKPVMKIEKDVILKMKNTSPLQQLKKFPSSVQEIMKPKLEQRLIELNKMSEDKLKEDFEKLSSMEQNDILNLHDCHQIDDKKKSLLGIASTNGLIQEKGGTLLFLKISKFNNSCLPNVAFEFVAPFGRVYSVKDIKKGDELCMDYGGYGSRFSTLKERQEMLNDKYDFTCACELCTMDTDKYRVIEYSRLRYKKLEDQIPKTTNPQTVGALIKERFEMMEKGKLMYPGLIAVHANDSFQLANGLGNHDEAKRYVKMVYESLLIKYGKDNQRTQLYKMYLDDKITANALVQNLSTIKINI